MAWIVLLIFSAFALTETVITFNVVYGNESLVSLHVSESYGPRLRSTVL